MIAKRQWPCIVLVLVMLTLSLPLSARAQGGRVGASEAFGPRADLSAQVQQSPPRYPVPTGSDPVGRFRYWSEILQAANALDHTPVMAGENRVFGEQVGPGKSSRAFAIVHIAMFEALNAILGGYRSYTGLTPAPAGASLDAAIAQAAHDALVGVYPSQVATFDTRLAEDLRQISDGQAKADGVQAGRRAAAMILALRANDGTRPGEARLGIDFIPSNLPGKWRQDPVSLNPLVVGATWGGVRPFVLRSSTQFPVRPVPSLTSAEYTTAFNEVKRLGGDGIVTPTERTPEQSVAGVYWGYDGVPGLGTPPRLYSQLALQLAAERGTPVLELGRLLALIHLAMADTGIAMWDDKFGYQFWRPVTGVREADVGTGPTGVGDGNPATIGDPTFTPLGAQASNLLAPNFTPPFPAYPSGHAGFGGATFQMLRNYFGTDAIPFTFVSDEFNGVTRDNQGNVRPRLPRTFASLSQAEEENGQSRIYLGVHWAFDKTEGISQGRRVADFVFTNALQPQARALVVPPTATPTPSSLPVAQAIALVQPTGVLGTPCASQVGQICQVSGATRGTGTVAANMSWRLAATVPAGVTPGTVPVAVISTTAGLQGFPCSAVGSAGTSVSCVGTTAANARQGSIVTVVFAPGVTATGTVNGTGPAGGSTQSGGPAVLIAPLLPPPPPIAVPPAPPPLVPPPMAPLLPPPLLAAAEPAPSLPGVPVVPEADSLPLLMVGLFGTFWMVQWRRRARR